MDIRNLGGEGYNVMLVRKTNKALEIEGEKLEQAIANTSISRISPRK
jgi:hypothetical protein